MAKKRVSKKKIVKLVILLVIAVIVFLGVFFLIKKVFQKPINKTTVVDKLDDYGYELLDKRGDYYNSLFSELKTELNKTNVDYDNYASLIARLFVADFFTLDNKISKNDVGGTQFVYSSYQTDFEKYAKEGIYHTVESNIYGNRKQTLPIVIDVEITSTNRREYDYLDLTDSEAYAIDVKITYKEDLEYQREASLIIVHTDNKLEIVKMS